MEITKLNNSITELKEDAAGRPVSSYESFVNYLLAKDAGIQRAWLGFEGKNTVLFRGAAGSGGAPMLASTVCSECR